MNDEDLKKDFMDLIKKVQPGLSEEAAGRYVLKWLRKVKLQTDMTFLPKDQIEIEIVKKLQGAERDNNRLKVKDFITKILKIQNPDPIKVLTFLMEMSYSMVNVGDVGFSKTTGSTPPLKPRFDTPNRHITDSMRSKTVVHSKPFLEPEKSNSALSSINMPRSHNYQISDELTEQDVIGDLLYIILVQKGKWLSWNDTLQRLDVQNGVNLSQNMYPYVCKISQCGTAYKIIRNYVDRGIRAVGSGVVCQGLCSALNVHLVSYTKLVDILQSQYNKWVIDNKNSGQISKSKFNRLTLDRIQLWLHDPLENLRFLVKLITDASDQKGGQLASTIYSYVRYGAPDKQMIVKNLLLCAVEPFYNILRHWIYDGILEECHQEFFVAMNPHFEFRRSWTDKYGLRSNMIPCFITESQAQKILLSGKSINFLREVCEEKIVLKDRKEIVRTLDVTAEAMINQDIDRSFENMINTVYTETSRYLLKVIFDKYNLMDHLKALRKYMLQGQGDFILRLIEIIGTELSRPGDELRAQNLGGSLDEAVRTTNAQYDSRDILDRLFVKFAKISEDETGWDIFWLSYNLQDVRPLEVLVNKDSMTFYLRVFTFLFRSRRVHFILNSLFKRQNSFRREVSTLRSDEVNKVLNFNQKMTMEMLHFVNQIQYYINFEVLECSWKKFMDSIGKATDLDAVMRYHEYFLHQVISRCLLEPESREILATLRSIFNLIISFESIQNEMFSKFKDELRLRRSFDDYIDQRKKEFKWGVDDDRQKSEDIRRNSFNSKIVTEFYHKLSAHHRQYEMHVVNFMSTLIDHKDPSLRFLYTNLDFNDRYKDLIRSHRKKFNP